jgi:protocatechuate 3,4-dioxygenase beta subunit
MTNLKIRLGVATAALFAAFAAPAAAQVSETSLTLVAAEEPGTRLLVTGTVVDLEGRPTAGARLHVFPRLRLSIR